MNVIAAASILMCDSFKFKDDNISKMNHNTNNSLKYIYIRWVFMNKKGGWRVKETFCEVLGSGTRKIAVMPTPENDIST